jgi:hypothetical protein
MWLSPMDGHMLQNQTSLLRAKCLSDCAAQLIMATKEDNMHCTSDAILCQQIKRKELTVLANSQYELQSVSASSPW